VGVRVDLLLYTMLVVGAVIGYVARRVREKASRASSRLLDATIYMLIFLVGARSAPYWSWPGPGTPSRW